MQFQNHYFLLDQGTFWGFLMAISAEKHGFQSVRCLPAFESQKVAKKIKFFEMGDRRYINFRPKKFSIFHSFPRAQAFYICVNIPPLFELSEYYTWNSENSGCFFIQNPLDSSKNSYYKFV